MSLADHPILVILAAAVAAPLLAEMPIARRTPIVALEVLLGIVVGPHVLGLIQFDAFLSAMLGIGTAAVLFMAGMEIDFERIRGRRLPFTPFCFVGTGIAFNLGALTGDVTTMLLVPTFLVLFLVVRGMPVLLYPSDIPKGEQLPFGLFASIA